MSAADDVLFGPAREEGPRVVDVTDAALAHSRAERAAAQARAVGAQGVVRPSPVDLAVPAPRDGRADAGPTGPGLDGAGLDSAGLDSAGPDVSRCAGDDPDGAVLDPSFEVELSLRSEARVLTARHQRAVAAVAMLCDGLGLAVGWAAAHATTDPRWHAVEPGRAATVVLLAALPVWWAVIAASGGYPQRLPTASALGAGPVRGALRGTGALLVVLLALCPGWAPAVALAVPVATTAAVALRRLAARTARRLGWAAGGRVLVVGSRAAAADVVRRLSGVRHGELHVVGRCAGESLGVAAAPHTVDGYGVGGADVARRRITASARAARADVVLVADPATLPPEGLRRLAWSLEGQGLAVMTGTGLIDVAPARLQVHPAGDLSLLRITEPAFTGGRRIVKEVFDRTGALVLLVVLAPLLLAVALAVRVAGPGPVLYVQPRVGRHGRTFRMVKFRSMDVGAEADRARLERHNDHGDAPLFKLRDDPRVTWLGRWLRRSSLDELPQLVNVLAGHMSLVGPRPPLPAEVERYGAVALRRLRVKPGMTGLWQVSGRSDLAWAESVRLDVSYVENWSVGLDLRILLRTVGAVCRGEGAR